MDAVPLPRLVPSEETPHPRLACPSRPSSTEIDNPAPLEELRKGPKEALDP